MPPKRNAKKRQGSSSPKAKRAKKKKDPNAPTGPRYGNTFYAVHMRESGEVGGVGVTEQAKEIGLRWKELTEEQKQVFKNIAAEDKELYQIEMAEYKGEFF
jgi:hypothetical protein